jgi:glycosyltransferase involved in cell wall biosynthesis
MIRLLMDERVRDGGVGRYARGLASGVTKDQRYMVNRVTKPSAFTPWGRRAVAKTAREWKADLVHGLHFEIPPASTPTVVTIPDLIPLQYPSSMPSRARRKYFSRMIDSSIRDAGLIVAPSQATAEALKERGAAPAKIRVIPLGVDGCFYPDDRVSEARTRFADGHHYVACVADDKPHKNLDAYIGAAKILASSDIRFLCRGATRRRTAEPVIFIEPLEDDDMRSFYRGADVLVVPSHIEGFGLPAVEALACGTPVIGGDGLGCLPYLDGEPIVVDVADPEAIAHAIKESGQTTDDAADLQRRHRVALGLSVDRMVGLTIEAYEELLNPGA